MSIPIANQNPESNEPVDSSFSGIGSTLVPDIKPEALNTVTAATHSSRRYDVGKVIAKGGMGAILNAKEAALERVVAMKVMLNTASSEALARFVCEAKVTGQLEHPNIVPVHELGVDDKAQPYYTMKMVRGVTLRKVLEDLAKKDRVTIAKYALADLLTIFQKVCDAMAFAHSKGIIHRDLKPENIMIGGFGEVLVMDWGLAKVLNANAKTATPKPVKGAKPNIELHENESGTQATLQGTILGTLRYMAPEQANGFIDQLDARSDIYALGGILYHILTLRTAVEGPSANSILLQICTGEFPSPIEATSAKTKLPHLPGGRVPESLSAVAMKALQLEQKDRYASVLELQRDIAAYQNGFATSAENAGVIKQFALLIKRHKATAIGAAAVLLVGGVLGTKAIIEGQRAEREAVHARSEAAHADEEAKRANAALAELKKSAPNMLALAESEALAQHFDSALEKTETALALDPGLLPAYWRRAWCFVALGKFSEAAQALRTASERDPANARQLSAILPQIEKIAAIPDKAGRYTPEVIAPVFDFLNAHDALGEAGALIAHLRLTNDQRFALARARLKAFGGSTNGLFQNAATGLIELNFTFAKLTTLDQVRSIPCDILKAPLANFESLEPLRGLRLVELDVGSNHALKDISALAGMPLRSISLRVCPGVSDLSPLHGMPLEIITVDGSGVTDLGPLAGMPLRTINAGQATDLRPLVGMPLENLTIRASGKTIDLSPLAGLPLKILAGTSGSNDLTPLLRIPTLERLETSAPPNVLAPLRQHPKLALIDYRGKGFRPAAEVWAEIDAMKAPGKK